MVQFIQLTVPVLEGKYKLTFKCTRKNKKRRKVDYFYLINDSLQPKILSRDYFFLIILVLVEYLVKSGCTFVLLRSLVYYLDFHFCYIP